MTLAQIFADCATHAESVNQQAYRLKEAARKANADVAEEKLLGHYAQVIQDLPQELLRHVDFSGDRGFDHMYGDYPVVVSLFYNHDDIRVRIHRGYDDRCVYYHACEAIRVNDSGEVEYDDAIGYSEQKDWRIAFAEAKELQANNRQIREAGYVKKRKGTDDDASPVEAYLHRAAAYKLTDDGMFSVALISVLKRIADAIEAGG